MSIGTLCSRQRLPPAEQARPWNSPLAEEDLRHYARPAEQASRRPLRPAEQTLRRRFRTEEKAWRDWRTLEQARRRNALSAARDGISEQCRHAAVAPEQPARLTRRCRRKRMRPLRRWTCSSLAQEFLSFARVPLIRRPLPSVADPFRRKRSDYHCWRRKCSAMKSGFPWPGCTTPATLGISHSGPQEVVGQAE